MKLMYAGDKNNEFFKVPVKRKLELIEMGFQWVGSRTISAFRYLDNDVVIRLHNGSLYLFEDLKDWAKKNLSTTIRRDIFGTIIRKKINFYYVGVLQFDNDIDETDHQLLYYYISEDKREHLLEMSTYRNNKRSETITFYGAADISIVDHKFVLSYYNGDAFYALGEILVNKIIDADWANWVKIEIDTDDDTINSINYLRRVYGDKIQILFTNPVKVIR